MTRVVDVKFRDRRDLPINWTTKNPILSSGEHGYEIGTGKFKIGDGILRWIQLPYFVPQGEASAPVTGEDLANHVNSETPHPVYDDMPSLVLLYQNAKV